MLTEGIKKLRVVEAKCNREGFNKSQELCHGVKNMNLDEIFESVGGTEMTVMSKKGEKGGGNQHTTLLMGEIDMLDKLEREGIYVNLYNKYMDDISIITDLINKEDKGRLYVRLKEELSIPHSCPRMSDQCDMINPPIEFVQ